MPESSITNRMSNQAQEGALQTLHSGGTIQQIQTNYATALSVQQPRDLKKVESRILAEAALAGETAYYGWSVGKKDDLVEGPSIEAAMIMLRNFGNCALVQRPIQETADSYIFTSAYVDLETGVTYERNFRQSKDWIVYGKMDKHRKEDVRFQIGQSKSDRNCILRVLPSWMANKIVEKAKEGVRAKLEKYIEENSIEAARKLMLGALLKAGVDEERAEAKAEKKSTQWTVEDLVQLKGDLSALQNGADSVDAIFPLPTIDISRTTLDPDKAKSGSESDHLNHDGKLSTESSESDGNVDKETGELSDTDTEEKEPQNRREARQALLKEIKGLEEKLGDEDAIANCRAAANIENLSRSKFDQLQIYIDVLTKDILNRTKSAETDPGLLAFDRTVALEKEAFNLKIMSTDELGDLRDEFAGYPDLRQSSIKQLAKYEAELKRLIGMVKSEPGVDNA